MAVASMAKSPHVGIQGNVTAAPTLPRTMATFTGEGDEVAGESPPCLASSSSLSPRAARGAEW